MGPPGKEIKKYVWLISENLSNFKPAILGISTRINHKIRTMNERNAIIIIIIRKKMEINYRAKLDLPLRSQNPKIGRYQTPCLMQESKPSTLNQWSSIFQ